VPTYTLKDFTFNCGIDWTATNGPLTDTPTYTNVSADVLAGRGISLKHGRAPESTRADVGQASFTLKNPAGAYTPVRTAAVTLGRPVQWKVTPPGGTAQTIWTGAISDYKVTRDSGSYGVTQVTANDSMAAVGGLTMRELLDADIRASAPAVYLPLNDGALGYAADALTGQRILSYTRSADSDVNTFLADTLWNGTAATRITKPGAPLTDGLSSRNSTLPCTATTQLSFSIWVRVNTTPTVGEVVNVINCTSDVFDTNYFAIDLVYNGLTGTDFTAKVEWASGGVVAPNILSSVLVYAGAWVKLDVIQSVSAGTRTTTLYVNSVAAGSVAGAGAAVVNPFAAFYVLNLGAGGQIGATSVTIADFTIHTRTLTQAEIINQNWLSVGWTGRYGVDNALDASARFQRLALLAMQKTTSARVASIITQPQTEVLQSITDVRAQKFLDAVDGAVTTCGGIIYASPLGVLTLRDAGYKYVATPAVTFDARTMLAEMATLADFNTQGLCNEATVAQVNGSEIAVRDQTSITANGQQSVTATTWSNRWTNAYELAAWLVTARATPTPKIDQLQVNVLAFVSAGGSFNALAALTIGSQVAVTNLPAEAAASTATLFVDSVEWHIDANNFTVTLGTSPALPFTVPVLDNAAAQLDTNIKLGL